MKRSERSVTTLHRRFGAVPAIVAALALTSGAGGGVASSPAAARAEPMFSLAGSLSDIRLAGQRVIYSYRGLEPPAALLRAIRAGQSAAAVAGLTQALRSRRLGRDAFIASVDRVLALRRSLEQ